MRDGGTSRRRALTALAFASLFAAHAAAQPASLVKDIKTSETELSTVQAHLSNGGLLYAASLGGALYFSADDGIHGFELWRSDGTPGGTTMVRDLCPGRCSGFRQWNEIVAVAGKLLFSADDGVHGLELWSSDGTAAGTALVADIEPGFGRSVPQWLTPVGDRLFFTASQGTTGAALWLSDGSPGGTLLLADVDPGDDPWGGPVALTALGETLVFFADDGVSGRELWRSDGTPLGTVMVKDIHPGPGSGFSHAPQPFPIQRTHAASAGRLFFGADDGVHGDELWSSDGTAGGTAMVQDLAAGSDDSGPSLFCDAAGTVFFGASGATPADGLWKTDGTAGGTARLHDVGPSFFSTCLPGRVFYAGFTAASGHELWTSDGTEAGTQLVTEIQAGSAGGLDGTWGFGGSALGDRFLFWADDGSHGAEPWVSDGTAGNTFPLGDLFAGPLGSSATPHFLQSTQWPLGGDALFFALTPEEGWEPWLTDGTPGGTRLLADLNTQLSSVAKFLDFTIPVGLADHGGTLAFVPDDGEHGGELWRSDGTEPGTQLVKDVWPGEAKGTGAYTLPVSLLGKVYFSGADSFGPNSADNEPWVSDLTLDGTLKLADTVPGGNGGDPHSFFASGGLVYFTSAGTGWVTDGTPGGTEPATLPPPPPQPPEPCSVTGFAAALNRSFLVVDDAPHGRELWSKLEPAGVPELVTDIRPGAVGSHPLCLTSTPGRVYFVADNGVHGRELWRSDGTVAGTSMVSDIVPGPGSSLPQDLRVVDGVLLFSAWDPVHGRELWASDGTSASTVRIQDIAPGPVSSSPFEVTASGSRIFFYATDAVRGFELWAMPRAALSERVSASLYYYTVNPCRLVDTRRGGGPPLPGLIVPAVVEPRGRCGVSQSARAVAANFTIVQPSSPGELWVGPGSVFDTATVVAFGAGQVRAGFGVVKLNESTGSFSLHVPQHGGDSTTHVVIDVVGYFE